MIKRFKMTDLGYFLPNEFSDPDKSLDQLGAPDATTLTLWDQGMVAAILCFRNYWGNNWHGFFLISSTFRPRLGMVLRDFIASTMELFNAQRLQTHSVDCKVLNDWHEFLGFQHEGMCRKMIYDQDYNIWARVREE